MPPDAELSGDHHGDDAAGRLIYKQKLATRLTHWLWAICLFFLLVSGLQIFNAHPTLYFGKESGFGYNNSVVSMTAKDTEAGPKGATTIFGKTFDTSGVLGMSYVRGEATPRGFPSWATLPSSQDLATGRVVHFFFAWIFVFTLIVWGIASLINGHFRRDIVPGLKDAKRLPQDVADHARFRLHRSRRYSPLQKLSYAIVLLVLFPLMILTGLSMSPGFNATAPWLLDVFGGRQGARTIHFFTMTALVAFFFVHVFMVVAAGPINEMRSMVTGWYRTGPRKKAGSAEPATAAPQAAE